MSLNKILSLENAKLLFRNFSGKEGRFNPAGRRSFNILLDSQLAEELKNDGWNVRWLKPRDPDGEEQPILQVFINFNNYPPKILVISTKGKTQLSEDTVNILDWAEMENVDLTVRPYLWEVGDKHGVKAFLKTMYVTIVEDELEQKYRDVPDSALDALTRDEDAPPWN